MADPITASRYEQRRLQELARWVRQGRVLDVGYAHRPNPWLPGPNREVTGIDIASPETETGYDRHLQGDIYDLAGLDDGRLYDTIVAGEFIEHVERPYELLRRFANSVAPGGRLLLSTPNPVGIPVVLFEWLRSGRRFYTGNHTYYLSPRWVARMLERTGWTVTKVIGLGPWPVPMPFPAGLSYQVVYVAERGLSDA